MRLERGLSSSSSSQGQVQTALSFCSNSSSILLRTTQALYFFSVSGIKPKAFCMLPKCCTWDPHCQANSFRETAAKAETTKLWKSTIGGKPFSLVFFSFYILQQNTMICPLSYARFILFLILCRSVCLCAHIHMCERRCLQSPQEEAESPEAAVTGSCELPIVHTEELHWEPLQEQSSLLASEPSL